MRSGGSVWYMWLYCLFFRKLYRLSPPLVFRTSLCRARRLLHVPELTQPWYAWDRILQWILFTACLTATYRRQFGINGSEHGFTFPGGQISIEFSIRFLRQDAPPPAPIRGVSPLSPAPPSASAPPVTSAPAPATGPLISTE